MEGFDEAKMKQLQLLKEKMKLAKSQKQEEAQKNEESGLNETKKDLNDVKNARSFDVKDARFNKTGSKKFDGFFPNKKIGYPKGSRYPFQQSKSVGFASRKGGGNKSANEVDLFDTPLTFEEVMRRKHERKKLELQKGNNEMESKNDVTNSKQGNVVGDKQEYGDNENGGNNGDHGNTGGGSSGMNDNDQLYKRFSSENLQNSTFDFTKTDNINPLGIKDSQYFSLPEFQKNESVTNDKMLNNSVHSLHETNDKQIPLHVESAIQMIDANNTSYIYHEVLMDISSSANNVLSAKVNNISMNSGNVHRNQISHTMPAVSDVNTDAKSYSLNNSGVKWREEEVVYNLTAPNEKLRERNEEAKAIVGNEQEHVYKKPQTMTQNILSAPNKHYMKTNELRSENKSDIPCADNASTFLENASKERNTNHWVSGGMSAVANVPSMSESLNNERSLISTEGTGKFGNCMVGRSSGIIGNSAECSNKQDARLGNVSNGQNIFANASKILETNRTIFGTNINVNNGIGTNRSSLGVGNNVMALKNNTTHLGNVSTNNNISNTANYMKSMPSNKFLSNDGFLMKTEHNQKAGVIDSTKPNLPVNSATTFVKNNNTVCFFHSGNSKSTNMSLVKNSPANTGAHNVGNSVSNNNNTWDDVNKSRLQENTITMEGFKIFKNSLLNMPRNTNQNICRNNENQGIDSSKLSSDNALYNIENSGDAKLETIKKGTDSTVILNRNMCGTEREDFASINNAVGNIPIGDKIGTNVTNMSTLFTNCTARSMPNTNTNAIAATAIATATATATAAGEVSDVKKVYAPTSLNSGVQMDSTINQKSLSINNVHMPLETRTKMENGNAIYARNTTTGTFSGTKVNNSSAYVDQAANTNMQQFLKNHILQEEVNNVRLLNEPTIFDQNKDILKSQREDKKTELAEQRKESVIDYTELISSHALISQGTVTNTGKDKEKDSITVENTPNHINLLKDECTDHSMLNRGHMMNQSITLKNDVIMDKGVTGTSEKFVTTHETIINPNEKDKIDASTENDALVFTEADTADLDKIKGKMTALRTNNNFNQDSVEINNIQWEKNDTDIVITSNNNNNNNNNTNVDNEKVKATNNDLKSINNNSMVAEKNIVTLKNNQWSMPTQECAPNRVIPKNDINGTNDNKTTAEGIIPFESTKGEGSNAIEEKCNKTVMDKETQMCLSNENKVCIVAVELINKEEYGKCKNTTQVVKESDEWSSKEQVSWGETDKKNTSVKTARIRISPEESRENKGTKEREKEEKGDGEEQKKLPTTETVAEVATGTVVESMAEIVASSATETKLETKKIELEEKEQEKEKEKEKEKKENNESSIWQNIGDNIKDQGDIFRIFQKNRDNMLDLNAEQFGNKEDFDKINQIYKNIGCINKNIIYMNKYIPSNIENVHDSINKNTRCMENYDALVKTNKVFLEKIKNENNSEEVNAELKTMINNLNKQMATTTVEKEVIKQPSVIAHEQVLQNLSVDMSGKDKMEFLNHCTNDSAGRCEGQEGDMSEKMPEHVKRIFQRREYFNGAKKMQINESTNENRKNQTTTGRENEQNANCKKMKPYVSLECREVFRNTFYTNDGNKNHLFVMDQKIQNNTRQDEQLGSITEKSVDARVCLTNDTHNDVSKEIKIVTENEAHCEMKGELNRDALDLQKNTECENQNSVVVVPKDELRVKAEVYKNTAGVSVMGTVKGSVDIIQDIAQKTNLQMEKDKRAEMKNEIKNMVELVRKLYEHINTDDYINLGRVAKKKRKQDDLDDSIDTERSTEYKMAKMQLENIDETNEEGQIDSKENQENQENQKNQENQEGDHKTTEKEAQKENEKTDFMYMHNHVMAITNAKTLEDFASTLTKYAYDSEQMLCDIITNNFDLSVKVNSLNDLPFLFEKLP